MLNSISIQGRLVRGPELAKTTTGVSVLRFTLAVDRDFKDASGNRSTDFIDFCAWRNTAEFISKYFRKGDMMAVDGRLQMNVWTDRDGKKRKTAEIQVANAYFCGGKATTSEVAGAPVNVEFTELDDDGEMPWDAEDGPLPF